MVNRSKASHALCATLLLLASQSGLRGQTSAYLVEAVQVVEQDVQASRRVVGTVQPARISTIGSGTDGRVEEYFAKVGAEVAAGKPLARLRTQTLDIEKAAASAQLQLFVKQKEELENGARPEEIAEAKAQAMAAKAAMDNAARQLERIKGLAIANAATDADVEDARERAEATRFVYAAAAAMLDRTEKGPRIEQIAQAAASVELQTQQVALIEDRKKKHTIQAPFDGFIVEEFTQVGAWVSAGDPIATVIELKRVEINAPASSDIAVKLNIGQEVRIEFPEMPDRLMTGTVQRIVPRAEGTARVFPVIIGLDNEIRGGTPLLLAGMLARIHLPDGPTRKRVVVPKDALVLNSRSKSVFVVDVDAAGVSTARKVAVELGLAVGGNFEVSGDLRPGDLVVTEGNERLADGQVVRVANLSSGS